MNSQGTPSPVRFLLLHAIGEEGDDGGPYKLAVSLEKLEAYREAGQGHCWVWVGQDDPFLVMEGWEVIDGAVTWYLMGELELDPPPDPDPLAFTPLREPLPPFPSDTTPGTFGLLDPNPTPPLD